MLQGVRLRAAVVRPYLKLVNAW